MKLTRETEEKLRQLLQNQHRQYTDTMKAAIDCYDRRLRLREIPDGEYKYGIWFPSLSEHRFCCNRIYKKGVKDATELLVHCKTHIHVAFLHGVSSAQLLFEVNQIAEREQLRSLIDEFEATGEEQ